MGDEIKSYKDCIIRDLFLVSYLHSLGFSVNLRLPESGEPSTKMYPEFEVLDITQDTVLSYFSDDCTMTLICNGKEYTTNPKKLFASYRDLRNLANQMRLNG